MIKRSRTIYVAAMLAGLAGVSACGSQAATERQAIVAPPASVAPLNPQGPGELGDLAAAEGGAEEQPPVEELPATAEPTVDPSADPSAGPSAEPEAVA